jgi:phosphohistidine phosphatase SixA
MRRIALDVPLALLCLVATFTCLTEAAVPTPGASLADGALIQALRQGGCVLVMRHASSPFAPPSKEAADPENTSLERQLDEAGRNSARNMGAAIKRLAIPVGEVWTSPRYRARQTAELAGLRPARIADELDEGAQGMKSSIDAQRTEWLRRKAAERPRTGTDLILVTHAPNIADAFGDLAANVEAGEALVFRPDGKGGTQLVARIKAQDWQGLARQSTG